jgi:hypothetical protein
MYKIVLKINGDVVETLLAGDFKAAYQVAMAAGKEDPTHWHMMMYPYALSQVDEAEIDLPVRVAWMDQADSAGNIRESLITRIVDNNLPISKDEDLQ